MRFDLVEQLKGSYSVRRMCELLGVSRSGYYASRQRPASQRKKDNQALVQEIRKIHQDSYQAYGSPRIHAELVAKGHSCSKNRVARLMKRHEIRAKRRRKRKKTTNSQHNYPIAPNLLQREFQAAQPNTKWLSDITYIPTAQGWLYLAVVLDMFSRKVVGWAMDQTLESVLTIRALKMALQTRNPEPGLIHHSDRGNQYAAADYQQLLQKHRINGSMSAIGNCYDNAPIESFFGTLKSELVHFRHYVTRKEARSDIFAYIEGFYNTRRRHSSLGYLSPSDYENSNASLFSVSIKSG